MGRYCSQCGILHHESGPRCPRHAAADQAQRQQRRIRDGRNLATWQTTRQLVLERDGYTCTCCGKPGTRHDPLTVDRINGGYHDTNLAAYRTLLRSCHGRHHGAHTQGRPRIANRSIPTQHPSNFARINAPLSPEGGA